MRVRFPTFAKALDMAHLLAKGGHAAVLVSNDSKRNPYGLEIDRMGAAYLKEVLNAA